MARLGATLVDVQLPRTELSIPVYYLIAPAEASSNLSRFDGVRYGHRAEHYEDLQSMYRSSRSEGFGPEVKRRIMIGTYVLSHGYYDAYYLQAQKLRRMIADDFQACFRECDVIAGPVAPTVAWPLGAQSDDPVANYLADIFTLPASLAGLPGMSIPAGFGAGDMPVGLQLVGNYFAEGTLLHAAHAFQRATDWHTRAALVEAGDERRIGAPGAARSRLRGRDRHRDACAAVDALEDLQRRLDRVRRRAEHAGVGGRPRPARHAAGRQPRRGRAGDPLRPGGGRDDRAGVDLRAQELLLPRPAQGLPDQPVRDAGRPGRRGRLLRRRSRAPGPADACASGRGRRQVAARRRPRRRPRRGAPLDFQGDWSGIDLNRAGTPLLEIVTEPDMRSSAEAVEYARALHTLVVWLGICDGNMQEGSFRCDANVSVRRPGAPFGTRREIKNLNSFRFMQQAIDYEVQWQIDLIEDGGSVQQATVLFDAEHGETRAMRSKEDAHDYRYFPIPTCRRW
jgi:hypothetical protein